LFGQQPDAGDMGIVIPPAEDLVEEGVVVTEGFPLEEEPLEEPQRAFANVTTPSAVGRQVVPVIVPTARRGGSTTSSTRRSSASSRDMT
jgi:hypothetical protein